MIVCVCAGANERDIRGAMAGGAATLADLGESCRAGQDCGECHGMLLEMLERDSCDDCPRHLRLPAGAAAQAGARA